MNVKPTDSTLRSAPFTGSGRSKGERQKIVYQSLRKEIQTLTLRPGETLDETKLARKFNTSRSPVREALIKLAADGLVVALPNRSTLVAPFDLLLIPKYLDSLSLLQRSTHYLAALHRQEKHLAVIRDMQSLFLTKIEQQDATAAIEANLEFHLAISEASCNPYLTNAYRRLLNEGIRMQHMHIEYLGWTPDEPGVREHQRLIDAITVKDAEAAEHLARSHAEQFDHKFIRFLSHRLSQHIQINATLAGEIVSTPSI
ncbi:GntR family transcriptional regulator [Desulfofustis limnaeus]|jgi:DNA-binding GntR family transcriptional regulator|uniref:GntR family transcriptional regulator n=1 Tax=Desulfofustis limnaeus TaxID=2740163 RepID=A0ABN6M2M4_9BACT|nr:GntR family transcriptional regulator [Desulfofustis limnaeus]MDX9896148.1 GntR family transcriptional regulator [Desulfofustis sp.]BDD85652.1 GntR family transcriptional regulator [Desulfofustis limnaeus]